jgi:hypothetical protein
MKAAMALSILLALSTGSGLQAEQSTGETQLQGCLRRSGSQYVLIDREGTSLDVSYNKKLKNLNGHEVKLTGRQLIRTIDTTPPGAASSTIQRPYFQVESAQDLSPNCQGYAQLK